jgi:hypothetical protein
MRIKKGLFIGIDYIGSSAELANCQNDAYDMYDLLSEKFGIDDVMILCEKEDESLHPTKKNILKALKWLCNDNDEGDVLWFHYSGHGGYEYDRSGDEADGKDETLIPLDYVRNGEINDDVINDYFAQVVRDGAILYNHSDCCHSGTNGDMEWRMVPDTSPPNSPIEENYYSNEPEYYEFEEDDWYNPYKQEDSGFMYYFKGTLFTMKQFWKKYWRYIRRERYSRYATKIRPEYKVKMGRDVHTRSITREVVKRRSTKGSDRWMFDRNPGADSLRGDGLVFKWSGCKDDQTSSDGFQGMANGAMTGCVITAIRKGKMDTWEEFLGYIRHVLKEGGYEQIPQLMCNKKIDPNSSCFDF